jgi:OOP family OmpA-OmpF porin
LSCALVGLSGTSPAAASEREASIDQFNPVEIGVFGGAHFYNKKSGLGRLQDSPTGISPDTSGAFGLRLSFNLNEWIGAEGEALILPTRTRDDSTREIILGYRAQIISTFIHAGYVRPFLLVGFGALSSFPGNTDIVERDTDDFFHIGVGAKFPITDMLGLRLDGRVMAPPAIASDIAKVGKETHYDGPDWEILLTAYLGLFGNPPPQPPLPPSVMPTPASPEPAPAPAPAPAPKVDLDPDHDGILGDKDKCPNEPEDFDGFQDDDGCPDPDNDGDGIADKLDACPNEPETFNGYRDEDGCPDEVPAAIKKFTGVIQGINFKTGSAEVTKDSHAVLDKAVDVLTDYPDVKLEISGHTDNVGKAEFNMELSRKRAESVKAYLVGKGIQADRLTAVGLGMDKPIDSNATMAGRANNRRTEFALVGARAK